MMKFFHNPRCRKSREALVLINEKGLDIDVVQYLKNPPSFEEFQIIIQKMRLKPIDLVRKNELLFKERFKGKEFSDDERINVLIENPKLIERPILVTENAAIIGRPPEDVLKVL